MYLFTYLYTKPTTNTETTAPAISLPPETGQICDNSYSLDSRGAANSLVQGCHSINITEACHGEAGKTPRSLATIEKEYGMPLF